MEITVNDYPKVAVVAITGRVDSSNSHELDAAFTGLADSGKRKIVVDLSGVDYMSSMGVRALISAKKAAKKRLGDVALATPSAAAQDVIDIAGLGHVFDVFDDLVLATQSV